MRARSTVSTTTQHQDTMRPPQSSSGKGHLIFLQRTCGDLHRSVGAMRQRKLERWERENAKDIDLPGYWGIHSSGVGRLPLGKLAAVARAGIKPYGAKSPEASGNMA